MKKGGLTVIGTLCLLAALVVQFPAMNDNTASAEKKKTFLEHADSIEGGETPTGSGKPETFRSAVGNVVFRQEKITLTCDRATDYPESNRITLAGNIFITDRAVEAYGDSGLYYPDHESGELAGNVRGRVIRDSLVTKSKKATFNMKTDELLLHDDAIAWHKGSQISGDTLSVHVREVKGTKKIDTILVLGHAFYAARDSVSTGKKLYHQLSGRKMAITLDDASRITGITVTGQAKSLRYLYDDRREPSGANFSSGNSIRMFFREGKLGRVLVTGNPLGRQYPNSMREKEEINLPGFLWREREIPRFKQ